MKLRCSSDRNRDVSSCAAPTGTRTYQVALLRQEQGRIKFPLYSSFFFISFFLSFSVSFLSFLKCCSLASIHICFSFFLASFPFLLSFPEQTYTLFCTNHFVLFLVIIAFSSKKIKETYNILHSKISGMIMELVFPNVWSHPARHVTLRWPVTCWESPRRWPFLPIMFLG